MFRSIKSVEKQDFNEQRAPYYNELVVEEHNDAHLETDEVLEDFAAHESHDDLDANGFLV